MLFSVSTKANVQTFLASVNEACVFGVAPAPDPWKHDDGGDACDSPHSFPLLDKALPFTVKLDGDADVTAA